MAKKIFTDESLNTFVDEIKAYTNETVSDSLGVHTGNSNIHVTTTNKSNWNAAYTHSTSAHARADATKVADSTTNGNILINGTETTVYSHPNSGVSAGTYKSVTVNAQGHVTAGSNPTTLSGYGITDAETKSDASAKLTEAKTYADNAATKVKNDLLNNAGGAYDTLKELGDLIDENKDAIEALEEIAAGKASAIHTHAISDVTNLQSVLDGKAASSHGTHVSYSTTAPVMDGTASAGSASTVARSDHKHPTDTSRASKTEFDSHNSDTTKHITTTERTNWNAAKTHADSAHAPSNAQPNQNAFSNIKVGTTTIAADTTTDTLTLAGTNVTITPDATNDKVTIAVADGTTSAKGVVQLTDSVTSTSTTTAATPKNVKAAYDLANTAKTTADGKANASHTHTVANITDLTATATELNYMDGVTSNVQTQLDSKATSSHKHSGSDITSGTVAAARLPVASDSAAGIVNTDAQSFKGVKTFTNNINVTGVRANSANTVDIGTSSAPFKSMYVKDLKIAPQTVSGSAIQAGRFTLEREGTATSNGLARLTVGNQIKSGAVGNSEGYIELYNTINGSAIIRTSHEDSRNIYIELPENGGTLITDDDLAEYSKTGHTHSASSITSGILPVEYGGTGNSDGYVRAGAEEGSTIGALATAEGRKVTASGSYSHAEGNYTEASGSSAHAEGQSSTASGIASHAEGNNATASGSYSHAEGDFTNASAKGAHAEGTYTLASSDYQHVQGKFNIEDKAGTYAHIVGNGTGTSDSSRSNAHTLDWDGNAWFAGNVFVGGTSQDDAASSKLISEADTKWAQIYDSGLTTAKVNSISNINISGYKKLMVVVACVNDGSNISKSGSVIFKATDGTTYQFPCWTNMFSTTANATSAGMAEFNIIDGYIVCPHASRHIRTSNFLSSTEGGTADNLTSTGGGIMKCTKALSTLAVSSLDQDSSCYFGVGSRVIVWGCKC